MRGRNRLRAAGDVPLLILPSDTRLEEHGMEAWLQKLKPDAVPTTSSAPRPLMSDMRLEVPGDLTLSGSPIMPGSS